MGERPLSPEEYRAAEGFSEDADAEAADLLVTALDEKADARLDEEQRYKDEAAGHRAAQKALKEVGRETEEKLDASQIELEQDKDLEAAVKEYEVLFKGLRALGTIRKNLKEEVTQLVDKINAEHENVFAGEDKAEYLRYFIWANALIKEYLTTHSEPSEKTQ